MRGVVTAWKRKSRARTMFRSPRQVLRMRESDRDPGKQAGHLVGVADPVELACDGVEGALVARRAAVDHVSRSTVWTTMGPAKASVARGR